MEEDPPLGASGNAAMEGPPEQPLHDLFDRSVRPRAVGLIVRPLTGIAVRMEMPGVPSRIRATECVGGTSRHQHDRGSERGYPTDTSLHRSISSQRVRTRLNGAPSEFEANHPVLADTCRTDHRIECQSLAKKAWCRRWTLKGRRACERTERVLAARRVRAQESLLAALRVRGQESLLAARRTPVARSHGPGWQPAAVRCLN